MMEISQEPTQAQIASYLGSRNGGEMVLLVNSIFDPAAQAHLTKALVQYHPVPVASPGTTPEKEKVKKGLNGFVGFRCHYLHIPVFKQHSMAIISPIIGKLWAADPDQSIWQLITKAWSIIRDQIGKDNAPLDHFLKIVGPVLKLPSPELYLQYHGWSVILNNQKQLELHRNNLAMSSALSASCADMPYSVDDIISLCQQSGYASGFDYDKNATSPTFLAHAYQHILGNIPKTTQTVQATDYAYEMRLLAKKQRRANRQEKRNTSGALALQTDIVNVYGHCDKEDAALSSSAFYSHVESMLANGMANNMAGNMMNNNAPVNNMTNHYMPIPGTAMQNPTQTSTQPVAQDTEFDNAQTESLDEQMDVEDEQVGFEDDQIDFDDAEAEFEGESTNEQTDFHHYDFNAFRNGANKDATLPAFNQDLL